MNVYSHLTSPRRDVQQEPQVLLVYELASIRPSHSVLLITFKWITLFSKSQLHSKRSCVQTPKWLILAVSHIKYFHCNFRRQSEMVVSPSHGLPPLFPPTGHTYLQLSPQCYVVHTSQTPNMRNKTCYYCSTVFLLPLFPFSILVLLKLPGWPMLGGLE